MEYISKPNRSLKQPEPITSESINHPQQPPYYHCYCRSNKYTQVAFVRSNKFTTCCQQNVLGHNQYTPALWFYIMHNLFHNEHD